MAAEAAIGGKTCSFKSQNDFWTTEIGGLGYGKLGTEVTRMLYQCEPPFAFAISGGWGSGKSSFLRYLMAITGGRLLEMDPEKILTQTKAAKGIPAQTLADWETLQKRFGPTGGLHAELPAIQLPSVWFNPWQHQFESHPFHALLHEIYNQFSAMAKAGQTIKKLGTVTLNSGLTMLREAFKTVIPDHREIMKHGKEYEERSFLSALDSQRFPLYFEQAARHLASCYHEKGQARDKPRDDARMLIFIDDLDRCQPKQAFELLQGIKLYLNTPHCVFVFAVDYRRLVRELARSISDFSVFKDHAEAHAADYLDKMFQASIRLPLPTKEVFKDFIQTCFTYKCCGDCVDLLARILEPNPRKTKNFINSLYLHMKMRDEVDCRNVILMHYLRLYYRNIYTVIETDPKLAVVDLGSALESKSTKNRVNYMRHLFQNDLAADQLLAEADTSVYDFSSDQLMSYHMQSDVYKAREEFLKELKTAIANEQFTQTALESLLK